jgi:hypothetical protein
VSWLFEPSTDKPIETIEKLIEIPQETPATCAPVKTTSTSETLRGVKKETNSERCSIKEVLYES